MKYIKTVIISLFFTGIWVTNAYSQYNESTMDYLFRARPSFDSLFIDVENKMQIEIATFNYAWLGDEIQQDITALQEILISDSNSWINHQNYSIIYIPGKSLSTKEIFPEEKIVFRNDKYIRYDLHNQCKILGVNYTMNIRFKDFNDIVSQELIAKIDEVRDSLPPKMRLAGSYYFSYDDKVLIQNNALNKINGNPDYIFMRTNIGMGLLYKEAVPTTSIHIGYSQSLKGLQKNEYYLSLNSYSFINENGGVNPNYFLNLGIHVNYSYNYNRPVWFGFEMGYLIHEEKNAFGNKDFVFTGSFDIGQYLRIKADNHFENFKDKNPVLGMRMEIEIPIYMNIGLNSRKIKKQKNY